jgi:hypothetical protein
MCLPESFTIKLTNRDRHLLASGLAPDVDGCRMDLAHFRANEVLSRLDLRLLPVARAHFQHTHFTRAARKPAPGNGARSSGEAAASRSGRPTAVRSAPRTSSRATHGRIEEYLTTTVTKR